MTTVYTNTYSPSADHGDNRFLGVAPNGRPADRTGAPSVDVESDPVAAGPRNAKSGEAWSDDPVRLYLNQIGCIPLLKRDEELRLASQVEINRRRFRRELLKCDFVARMAVDLLTKVAAGKLPFDRTVQVAVSDRLEKHQIQGRLPINLQTLEALLEANRQDFQYVIKKSQTGARRRPHGPASFADDGELLD